MAEFIAYVGLDVHKDTIAVAAALPAAGAPDNRNESPSAGLFPGDPLSFNFPVVSPRQASGRCRA